MTKPPLAWALLDACDSFVKCIGRARNNRVAEDGDDEDYAGYANKMKSSALGLLDAIKLNDSNRAASAVGGMTQSCTECHELYRS